jgi:hypothetical protein
MTVIRDFKDQLFANLTGSINCKSFTWIILLIALTEKLLLNFAQVLLKFFLG